MGVQKTWVKLKRRHGENNVADRESDEWGLRVAHICIIVKFEKTAVRSVILKVIGREQMRFIDLGGVGR